MGWTRNLAKPIALKDVRTIATLAEARDVMVELPRVHQTNPLWQSAGELLLDAAYRNRQAPILDVYRQLSLALKADGLI